MKNHLAEGVAAMGPKVDLYLTCKNIVADMENGDSIDQADLELLMETLPRLHGTL